MGRANDSDSAWDVSRPCVRLWLTLALGLLGMRLFPFEEGFAPDAFAHARGTPLFAWLVAAFGGVWLLHRMELTGMPKFQYLLMGLALVLSLVIPPFVRGVLLPGDQNTAGFFCFCLIVLLLIAGASALQARQRPNAGSLRACLLRGPVLALTAPLLLYASRPVGGNTPASALQRLTRALFAVLPMCSRSALPCRSFLVCGDTTRFPRGWACGGKRLRYGHALAAPCFSC